MKIAKLAVSGVAVAVCISMLVLCLVDFFRNV